MTYNITQELKQTFDLATLRHKAKSLRTATDWEKAARIMDSYKRENIKQTKIYYAEYETRFEQALKQRSDKAGANNKTLTHRLFGADKFNKDALTRQAHRDVQQDHHRRMGMLAENETRELSTLTAQAEQRDRLRDKPKQEFDKTTDRRARNGLPQDRRQPRPRNRDR